MLPFVLTAVQGIGSALWSLASSRIGQIILAASLAFGWGDYRANVAWEARVAAQDAALRQAHAEELAREADAARNIGAAASARADDDAAVIAELRAQIEQLKDKEPADVSPIVRTIRVPAAPRACAIDDDLAGVVRRFDAAGDRKAASARSAR